MPQPLGYLFMDHRASPGLPESFARRMGVDPKLVAEGGLFEADTLRCNHCGTPVIKNPYRVRARGNCSKCNSYICDGCAGALKANGVCRPFTQVVDDVMDGKTPIAVLAKDVKE